VDRATVALLPLSALFGTAAGSFVWGGSALALVPALGVAAAVISIPAALSLALIWIFGRETQGPDLRELEPAAGARTDPLRS
jgi:hypothetical protein